MRIFLLLAIVAIMACSSQDKRSPVDQLEPELIDPAAGLDNM